MTTLRAPGRPRDGAIDEAILLATWELLHEVGYTGLTMTAVAEAAGIQKPALYRRWPTKPLLVIDVLAAHLPRLVFRDLGSLRADLTDHLAQNAATWSSAAVQRTFSPLLSDLMDDPLAMTAFSERVLHARADVLRAAINAAEERGELRPDAPVGLVPALVEGPLIHRALLGGARKVDEDLLEGVLSSVLTLLGAD